MKQRLIIIGIAICQLVAAQEYTTLHVNGTILDKTANKQLTTGYSFNKSNQFLFKTSNANAMIINTNTGNRFILKESNSSDALASSNLTPSMGNISSRSGSALNNRLDLMNHFQGKYVILGTLKVIVNASVFPMNESEFFFIRYIYKGEEINKRLSYRGDTLFINKDSLLRIDNKPILNEDITEMKMMYYSKKTDKAVVTEISSSFYPIFPNENELKTEVNIINNALKQKTENQTIKDIADYINEVYGNVNIENLKDWYHHGFITKN